MVNTEYSFTIARHEKIAVELLCTEYKGRERATRILESIFKYSTRIEQIGKVSWIFLYHIIGGYIYIIASASCTGLNLKEKAGKMFHV